MTNDRVVAAAPFVIRHFGRNREQVPRFALSSLRFENTSPTLRQVGALANILTMQKRHMRLTRNHGIAEILENS
jgi:hypothetical protein